MSQFQICKKCVMDTTDPDIVFDDDGICNHCRHYEEEEQKRKAEKLNLPWLYNSIREAGQGKKYDCVIGLSGGVDSSLALHYLVENGIRPFAFSVDNGYNIPEADENIMRLVEGMKVPFYRYILDLDKFKSLQAAFIKSGTPNIEIPTDHVLMAVSYEMAIERGVRFIISGGNLATESIMPKSWGYNARDDIFVRSIYSTFTGEKLTGLPLISLWKQIACRFIQKIKIINLLDYYEYNREAAKGLLHEKYGWKDYGEKHCENTFTWWFQTYYLPTKFGIDKRKAHYSSLINSGQLTRKDALDSLAYAPVYPELGMERKVLKYPNKTHRDYRNREWLWDLLSNIYGNLKTK